MTPGLPRRAERLVERDIWRRMLACCESGGPWPLVLLGSVGSGKTCAALCVLDRVDPSSRRYDGLPQLCETLIAIQNREREYGRAIDTPSWWWRRYRTVYCTAVDEVGARDRVSDFQYETLKRCLDERVERPSIFISNQRLEDLERVYDDRIASRLAGGTVLRFQGADRRLQQAGNHVLGPDGEQKGGE